MNAKHSEARFGSWPVRLAALVSIGAALAITTACPQDAGFTELRRIDSFQQERRNEVDLLIVIDNSCSMFEEQENLASNFAALIDTFTEADVYWRLAVTTTDVESDRYRGLLMGGDDEIILSWPPSEDPEDPSGELDRVEYNRAWEFERGTSLALDGEKYRSTFNKTRSNYCSSTNEFSDASFGTPGERNPSCDTGNDVDPVNTGPDDGPRAPNAGDVFFSEIMPESAGLDSLCEWVELANKTDDTIDIGGLMISDAGRNRALLPASLTIAPNGHIVIGRSLDVSLNCNTPVDVAFPEGFTLNDNIRIIDRDTPDGDELFSELVAQGTIGTGIEMGLEAARLVFEPEYYVEHNDAWLREDANLSILFVSDEDDVSPYPVDAYLRYFTNLKGDKAYRDRSTLNLSAVVGKNKPPVDNIPACESDSGSAVYGSRYIHAANATEGLVESICADDFAPIVSKLGLTLSGLELEFALSAVPQIDTMEVGLYEGPTTDSFVRMLIQGTDFTYDCIENKILFVEEQVPPSEWYVTVTYELSPSTDSTVNCVTEGS